MANHKLKVQDDESGNVSYKKNVVLSIVNLATQEINGVASLSSTAVSKIKRLFNKNYHRGVIIEFVDDSVYVDVFINVMFGFSVRDVAFRVQENIKSSIESMTDYRVESVNVNVSGVVFTEVETASII